MQIDNSFDQKSNIIVLEVFWCKNFKKIRGSKYENVKNLKTEILIMVMEPLKNRSNIKIHMQVLVESDFCLD